MATHGWRVGILGATGAVGRTFLDCLDSSPLEIAELRLTASARSEGTRLTFRGSDHLVRTASDEAFAGCDLVLCSAGAAAAESWAPRLAAQGAWVVDNSSRFRLEPDVPLVVPEVNAHALPSLRDSRRLVANPNCSTIQLVVALAPLARRFGLARVFAATYQSASGRGQVGRESLEREARGDVDAPTRSAFPARLFENVVPQCDALLDDGWTREEEKMLRETRKILELPDLPVHVTCVRVPVAVAHSEAVYVELERDFRLEEVEEILRAAPGIRFRSPDEAPPYPTPLEMAGTDPVWLGRVRRDRSHPRGLHLWVVADNLRKGAALNAVQIATILWERSRPSGAVSAPPRAGVSRS